MTRCSRWRKGSRVGIWTAVCTAVPAALASVLASCTDDTPASSGSDGGASTVVDASQGNDAGGGGSDGGVADSGNTSSDSGDTGSTPVVTETTAPSGIITVWPDALFGYFFTDNAVVRVSNAPECVVHLRASNKPFASAGDHLTFGGDFVGQDGGFPTVQDFPPADQSAEAYQNAYEVVGGPPFFYPDENDPRGLGSLSIQLATSGSDWVPAMPVQTLHSPAVPLVEVSKPVLPTDGTNIQVAHDSPFVVQWTVPAGDVANQRMVVSFSSLTSVNRIGDLRCGYPLSAGQATIPANVMTEYWSRLGGGAAGVLANGVLRILAGDQREVVVNGASYVIEIATHGGTSFGAPVGGEVFFDLK